MMRGGPVADSSWTSPDIERCPPSRRRRSSANGVAPESVTSPLLERGDRPRFGCGLARVSAAARRRPGAELRLCSAEYPVSKLCVPDLDGFQQASGP